MGCGHMSRRLLGVFAHPDDESFGPSGTLAVHSAAGVDVHVVTMTDGVAGAPAAGFPGGDALAAVRQEELRAATRVLGATLHHLSYRDSGYTGDPRNDDPRAFINLDPEEPTAVLVGLLREIRPHVVVTHDEQGGYHHPDHIRCHELVRAAFRAAGDATRFPDGGVPFMPARLYSETRSNRWIKMATRAMRVVGRDPTRVGVNADVDLTRVGVDPARITTRIDVRAAWPTKVAAAACHVSQRGDTGPMSRVPPWLMARIAPYELFIREEPAPWPGLRERSLFD